MANPRHDSPFEDMLSDHMRLEKMAEKAKAMPRGRQGVGNAELREKWAKLGDAERRRIRRENATADDPEGVLAMMQILLPSGEEEA